MTRYVVEAHYDDGSRHVFGDPPFPNAELAVAFGENMLLFRDAIPTTQPTRLLLDYAVIPLNSTQPEE